MNTAYRSNSVRGRLIHQVAAALTILLLSACASVQPKPGFSDVQQLVGKKINQQIRWNQGRE